MIDINLLPSGMRKQTGLSSVSIDIPSEITLGVGGSVIILLILTNIGLGLFCGYKGVVMATKKAVWDKMQPARKSIDDINKESTDIRNKVTGIKNAVVTKSTGWSRKLNIISDAVTKGMWLKKITVDAKSLTIEGYAVSKVQSDMTTVNAFVGTLRKDAFFMTDFSSIDINNVNREKRGMVDISKFSITAKVK